MEVVKEVCPTEILIDFQDTTSLCANLKASEFSKDAFFMNKEFIKQQGIETFLDLPPCRITNEDDDCFDLNATVRANEEGNLKRKLFIEDCPTGILVDVPCHSYHSFKQHLPLNNSQDLQCCINANYGEGSNSEEDSVDSTPKIDEVNSQGFIQRQSWKMPSPRSMSRISKEASEVIHNLNSSIIFEEDSLLTEEICPIPINFDLEDSIEKIDIVNFENEKLDSLSSMENPSVMTEDMKIVIDNDIPEYFENSATKSFLESSLSKLSLEDSDKLNSNSNELFSSELSSNSLTNYKFPAISEGTDDVFIEKNSSEDKENFQENGTLFKDLKINKATHKTPLKSKNKLEFRGTLRNLSNIKDEINNSPKRQTSNGIKNDATPSRKIGLPTKTKLSDSATRKLKLQNTKEGNLSVQKPYSTMKYPSLNSISFCKKTSPGLTSLNECSRVKTPLKRYSTGTPAKSSSAMKPPLTPASHSSRNTAASRITPQPATVSRISFSKSWQQHIDNSTLSNSKSMKKQGYISVTPSIKTSKIKCGKENAFNPRHQSFSQSMSAVSFQLLKTSVTTSIKSNVCRKMTSLSSLPVKQNQNLTKRELFPSAVNK